MQCAAEWSAPGSLASRGVDSPGSDPGPAVIRSAATPGGAPCPCDAPRRQPRTGQQVLGTPAQAPSDDRATNSARHSVSWHEAGVLGEPPAERVHVFLPAQRSVQPGGVECVYLTIGLTTETADL